MTQPDERAALRVRCPRCGIQVFLGEGIASAACSACGSPVPRTPAPAPAGATSTGSSDATRPMPAAVPAVAPEEILDPVVAWTQKRRVAVGANVLVMVLLAIGILAGVNYLAARVSFLKWKKDFTETGEYSLSAESKAIVKGLGKKVQVYKIAYPPQDHMDDLVWQRVDSLLKEYVDSTDKIELITIDPSRDTMRHRQLAKEWGLERNPPEKNLVVVCEDRKKVLEFYQLFEQSDPYSPEGPKIKKITAEIIITSALQSVTSPTKTVLQFTVGHQEHDLSDFNESGISQLKDFLSRREDIECKTLNLDKAGAVPDKDCDAVVICGPEGKFSQAELDALKAYLERGGRILILADPTGAETGLEDWLKPWGAVLRRDRVAYEGSPTAQLITQQGIIPVLGLVKVFEGYGQHPITDKLRGKVSTTFVSACPITRDAAVRPQILATPLAQTGTQMKSGAIETLVENGQQQYREDPSIRPPIVIAMALAEQEDTEEGRTPDNPAGQQTRWKMVVVGSSSISINAFSVLFLEQPDFIVNSIRWLTDRENLIKISPKDPGDKTIDIQPNQRTWIFFLTVLGLPLVCVTCGLIMWWSRR